WISAVGELRQPILSSSRPTWKPSLRVSTMNAVGPSGARASTVQTSAMGPLVMKILVPLMTQSSPSGRAVARMPPASLPASGWVAGAVLVALRRAGGVDVASELQHAGVEGLFLVGQREVHAGMLTRAHVERSGRCRLLAALPAEVLAEGQDDEDQEQQPDEAD